MITKAERTELRSIVRQQFKVLRAEIGQRQAEMRSEIEARIVERYRDVDEQRAQLTWKANEILDAASREITDLFIGAGADRGDPYRDPEISIERPIRVAMERIAWNTEDRVQLRRAMHSAVEADIRAALLRLDRQEADLLRTLSVGALESAEAQAFLASIPTVGELVPAARLAELEAQFANEDGG